MLERLIAGALAVWTAGALAAQQINDPARGWDRLWREYLVDVTIIFVVFAGLGAWFMWRYRRRSPDEVGSAPPLSRAAAVGWVVIPVFVFMADDLYLAARTWQLWNVYRDVPADRLEVRLEAAMWRWDFTYPNGVQATNELRVPAGKPVMLRMTATDVVHSFYLPDFRVKEDSMPGRVTYLWFYPQKTGEYLATCAEYCGMMHSKMTGKVIVVPPAEFAAWYEDEARKLAQAKPAATGG
jgi:cytochrome c oxidase subunit 2